MLQAPYHPGTYPPPGPMWPRFGDKHLDHAMRTLTQDAHKLLMEKHLDMQQLHMAPPPRDYTVPARDSTVPTRDSTVPTREYTVWYSFINDKGRAWAGKRSRTEFN